jgi:hypothetical protein
MHRLFSRARDNRFLSGIRLTPLGSRILNLHFTDDTLLFLKATNTNVDKTFNGIILTVYPTRIMPDKADMGKDLFY